jgi:hypothetical protein
MYFWMSCEASGSSDSPSQWPPGLLQDHHRVRKNPCWWRHVVRTTGPATARMTLHREGP